MTQINPIEAHLGFEFDEPGMAVKNDFKNTDFIKVKQLLELGFKAVQPRFYEREFSYNWYRYIKADFKLDVTIEYNLKGCVIVQYVELNNCKITGTHTLKQIKQLIKLL